MGSSTKFAKTILIPACIALTIYILFSCLIIPFFRRYHQRYSQYLPLNTLSAHTVSLRDRLADSIMHLFLRSTWRRSPATHAGYGNEHEHEHDNVSIDEEQGEMMVGMGEGDRAANAARRREALERSRRRMAAGRFQFGEDADPDRQDRLSRDLEEGFMDDSEDEGEDGNRNGPAGGRERQQGEEPVVRGVMGTWSRR
ncbi:Uncharacterized protein PECH_001487 [Penicillium ucsense]|uniref:Uncharacterized protein n=1 Tax=Penicillium ucsense TaxID=2839758 RepID=A0A8J8W5S8_9EURO|nr:Uncharacterized protein PECM_001125 [Penicillium ucsense]KAF7738256.1 Uncharacterized protein PECH_001487 [Penicillium ucsense]